MIIEIELEADLVRRLLHITGESSPTDAIRYALNEYVSEKATERFLAVAGTIEFDPDYLAEREREHPGTIR